MIFIPWQDAVTDQETEIAKSAPAYVPGRRAQDMGHGMLIT